MPNLAKMWTREEVLALALFRLLDPYVSGNRLGRLMLSPADLDLRSNQLVQPDLFVVPAIGNRRPARWDECGIPSLIVEVLSPSTARYDRMTKRRRYQRSGVPVYWVVDVDARLVEAWTPADAKPAILTETLSWQSPGAAESLTVDLPEYFREVLAE